MAKQNYEQSQQSQQKPSDSRSTTSSQKTPTPKNSSNGKTVVVQNSPTTHVNNLLDAYEAKPSESQLNEIILAIRNLKKNNKNNKIAIKLQGKLNDIREAHNNTGTTAVADVNDDAASLVAISIAIKKEKFATARLEAQKMGDETDKNEQLTKISSAHKNAKMSLQLTVNGSFDIGDIDKLLQAPMHIWGSPEDKSWAQNLKSQSIKRIRAKENEGKPKKPEIILPVVTAADSEEKEISVPTNIHGVNFQALVIGSEISSLLKEHKYDEASRSCDLLPSSYQEHQALNLMIQLHQQSIQSMGQAFEKRGVKFRIKAPFKSKEKWSLISFSKTNLQIRSPQGSQTSVKWSSLEDGTVGELYGIIASHADGSAQEFAMSSIAYLVDDQLGQAKQATAKARRAKYTNIKELTLLMNINKYAGTAFNCDALVEAVKAKDKKAISSELKALKASPDADDENVQALIQQASGTVPEELVAVKKELHINAKKNNLDFSDPDDLLAFSMRMGSWAVQDGVLTCSAKGSQLERDDAHNIKSVAFDLTLLDTKGTIGIQFRGVQLLIKLDEQGFQLKHEDSITDLKGFPFIAQLPYTITMKVEADNTMRVNINQTAEQTMPISKESGKMGFDIQGNSSLTIDNILLERDISNELPSVDIEKQNLIKTALGWDPIGGAELHVPQIILPPWPGKRSAIVRTLNNNNSSVSLEVKGSGDLYIMLGDRSSGNLDGLKIPMPLDSDITLFVNISWTTNTLRIESREGADGNSQVNTINDMNVPLKQLSIESSRRITILKPPQLK
ncbi:MAG: hypothetical protein HRU15_14075 [Planctomycetes bacterium]|nr:hypothetical protein [Planctomycetota bacterium]